MFGIGAAEIVVLLVLLVIAIVAIGLPILAFRIGVRVGRQEGRLERIEGQADKAQ